MGSDRSIVITLLDFVVWTLGLLLVAVLSGASLAVSHGVVGELPSWSAGAMGVYDGLREAVSGLYLKDIEGAAPWYADAGLLGVAAFGLLVRWFAGFFASLGLVLVLAVAAYFAIPALLG